MMLWKVEWEGKFGFAWRIVKDVVNEVGPGNAVHP